MVNRINTVGNNAFYLKYAEMLAIVVHENMKLGDNTLNNLGSFTRKQEVSDKKKREANVSLTLS